MEWQALTALFPMLQDFKKNNVNVKVICLRPIERIKEGILNKKVMGKYNGIEYEYPSGTTVRPETFIKRRIINLKGILKTISNIYFYSNFTIKLCKIIEDKTSKIGIINDSWDS